MLQWFFMNIYDILERSPKCPIVNPVTWPHKVSLVNWMGGFFLIGTPCVLTMRCLLQYCPGQYWFCTMLPFGLTTHATTWSSPCQENSNSTHSSFPLIHKVDNIGIFVQLLTKINKKQLRTKSISMQIGIYNDALNSYWSAWFLYLNYFQK